MSFKDQERSRCCFLEWMQLQDANLEELVGAKAAAATENDLRLLVAKNVQLYENYSAQRTALAKKDASSIFCARWCSSFESTFLWIGGCRPSMAVRLLYTLSGMELEFHLNEFLRGLTIEVNGLTAHQMALVNDLHLRIMREEDTLSSRVASLQEDIADRPFVPMSRNREALDSDELKSAMAVYEESLARITEQADGLRLEMLRELVKILSPVQAVDYLVAAKQLQLSLHEWCSRRDRPLGGE
ncbi:unnamed protein product [Spirodela intermedia]|uniref:DOG1 domain-containing protein n=1 Tax=Spirodela intermedia TaxID=51605 RepID=A0A7I8KYF5_SPIIN|nr:unnamed protein product [Spirodela intermedia]